MHTIAFIGWQEGLIFGAIVLLLFGARKLPELARSMGSSITQFKKGLSDDPEAAGSIGESSGEGDTSKERE